MKNNNKTIFDFINAINYKNRIEYDKKIAPAYMLSMWFSHDIKLLDIINEINKIQFTLPDKIIYKYLYHKIPKGKRFLKWTKKDKDKNVSEKIKESFNDLNGKYNISKREFSYYRDLLLKKDTESDVVNEYF
jgi:hypothetical protein